MLEIEFASFSSPGRSKPNQDRLLEPVRFGNDYICAIADGVGGRPGGAEAAECAIKSIAQQAEKSAKPTVFELFSNVSQDLDALAETSDLLESMATTLSALLLGANSAIVGHLGDTRIYHLRGDGIMSRTRDQTEVQNLLDRNIITKKQAERYGRKNVLTNYLGVKRLEDLFEMTFEIEAGDRIVLLTDGVYRSVLKREMRDLSISSKTAEQFCRKVREEVENRPILDDYSALFIEVLMANK